MIMTVLIVAMIGLIVLYNYKRKQINSEAATDPLTGGLAERFFQLRAHTILKNKENCFALISMQVNNMSDICVSFGPGEQNATLNRLHSALETQLSSEELFVRTGEDTFASIGDGNIDFVPVIEAFEKNGANYMFVEQDKTPGCPFEALKRSYDYIQTIYKEN